MRLEYLPEGSPDCPLIRLSHFSMAEAAVLRDEVTRLATGQVEIVAVHELPGVIPVDECELVFRLFGRDQAVVQVEPTAFECGFTVDTWNNMADLIEPFAADAQGYQWLTDGPGEISLLLSANGHW